MPQKSRWPEASIRFRDSYEVIPPCDCWIWTKTTTPSGYGQFRIGSDSRQIMAHRASWILHRGQIPDGLRVLHHCDTPPCVNPDHLYVGTQKDNEVDRSRRGRTNLTVRTREEVLAIRAEYDAAPTGINGRKRKGSILSIAAKYGIANAVVCQIGLRKIWAWL